MAEDKNFLNLQALNNSLKVIEHADNYAKDISLDNILVEIKKDLKKINFEHGNCFSNYQSLIDTISVNLKDVGEDISSLSVSLSKTIDNFNDFEKTSYRKSEIGANLGEAVGESNVTTIPPASSGETTTIPQPEVEEKAEINTVPIGLGIAATGIAGSVGAIVLDSMHYTGKEELESYMEPDEVIEEKIDKPKEVNNNDFDEDEFISSDHTFDDVTPYHASRDKKKEEKFYGE